MNPELNATRNAVKMTQPKPLTKEDLVNLEDMTNIFKLTVPPLSAKAVSLDKLSSALQGLLDELEHWWTTPQIHKDTLLNENKVLIKKWLGAVLKK